ncbi:MAG: DUF1993 domain-containing protein [Myxococcota bacterium]
MALFHQTIPQLLKMFTNLEGWLNKAEAFCSDNEIPLDVLLEQRLYPNMYTLRGQVQFACNNATLLADRIGGVARPEILDDEQTLDDLRNKVAKTRAFLESVTAEKAEGAAERMVTIPAIKGMEIRTDDLAKDFSIPNVYFHLTTAYGIMRQLGIPLGKADFLGPLGLVPASA